MFPSLRAQGNIMSNNVSATMCPRLPVPLYRGSTVFQLIKEWTISSVRPSNSGCTRTVKRAKALPVKTTGARAHALLAKSADLQGTTLSHTTSLRLAYDMNCFL